MVRKSEEGAGQARTCLMELIDPEGDLDGVVMQFDDGEHEARKHGLTEGARLRGEWRPSSSLLYLRVAVTRKQ